MMETYQLWAVGIVVFAAGALSRRPAHGDRKGKDLLVYWIGFYGLLFAFLYAVIRIFSPQDLVGETAPNDGEVWALTTASWAGAMAGAFTGQWLRRLRKTR
jgi:hypothetical protein